MNLDEVLASLESLKDNLNDGGKRTIDGLKAAIRTLFDDRKGTKMPLERSSPETGPAKETLAEEKEDFKPFTTTKKKHPYRRT